MSRKPEKQPEADNKKRRRKKKTKQTLTRAVTHIRLIEANPGKLAALDALLAVYLPLCQQYTTRFCQAETSPDKYMDPVCESVAPYHKEQFKDHPLNTSTTLQKRHGAWWLTLSFDQDVPVHTEPCAPVVGVDVGIVHFLTTSTGKEYGSFHGKMARQHKRDQAKRRRKAKLRACLEKKGVPRRSSPRRAQPPGNA